MNKVENKKGNTGYIVGYWNTIFVSATAPRNGKLQTYAKEVTIASCGKVRMTLWENSGGKMTKTFHSPDRPVYATIEDAKEACEELASSFVQTSREHTAELKEYDEVHYKGVYDWWEAKDAEYAEWLRVLDSSELVHEVVFL